MTADRVPAPDHVAVLGAGMVGLSTAWFLQERGVQVTVIEKSAVAAGSSWGNAGWLTPSIAVPLAEPSVLRYGLRAVLSPKSPVYVPLTTDPRLLRFLAQFALHCTQRHWQRSMQALIPLNNGALDAFDQLERGGVEARTMAANPFTAAFRTAEDSQALLQEFEHIEASGQRVAFDVVDGDVARKDEPALSEEVGTAIRIRDERFINPPAFVAALAASVRARGGTIIEDAGDRAVTTTPTGVLVGEDRYDAVVLATGAWLDRDARQYGVRRIIQAGRGYSFTVDIDELPRGPVYFPTQRVACTPVGDRLRIAGMMEFRDVGAPRDPRRIDALVEQAGQLLAGAHLDERHDEWVGARPCTADGLPLVGATRDPRVFVAGGHGMWGITLGPVTGRLLAEQVVTGRTPDALRGVDPLR
ncbi:D-amino-acid dehydrogenase [Nocardioides sp. J9]|uniref:NAD(P)/FAD-dependent oxidoreductase n=1 Tax=Nocardioides sp. J9 TaxID=935844 RepID=UPI00119EEDB9|nr:FAD-dependent oxidoreductase [Nocardioides sp. J9]TWH03378.1 D-amino-acid dehydrogenase [Nocardioides sp. J9]